MSSPCQFYIHLLGLAAKDLALGCLRSEMLFQDEDQRWEKKKKMKIKSCLGQALD